MHYPITLDVGPSTEQRGRALGACEWSDADRVAVGTRAPTRGLMRTLKPRYTPKVPIAATTFEAEVEGKR
eukprot:CAMPEP_0182579200 /NCGR_PEP_ID=MMETSP1324-20130603/43558_1 /TAXON_ID=236786 /ORGANISM="Florenciella sp., Strain RCC1587" /LENGTH=69 /DNA_ID=CAMNT_0024795267 /DNA_START=34 /DNA_END=243 /DNA_ORIENTATION=-